MLDRHCFKVYGRFYRFLWITVAVWIIAAAIRPGLAQAGRPIELVSDRDRFNVGPVLDQLEDPSGDLTIDQVASADLSGRWVPNRYRGIHVGHTTSAWWFRFKLRRDMDSAAGVRGRDQTSDWFLEFSKPGIGRIDLYEPRAMEKTGVAESKWLVRETGAARPPDSRDVSFRTYILKLPSDYNQDEYFYLRVETIVSLNMDVTIWSPAALAKRTSMDYLGFGVVFGIIAAMILYNLIVGVFLRDRVYLIYALFVTGMLLHFLFLYGHIQVFLNLSGKVYLALFWVILSNAWFWATAFTKTFLRTSIYAPRLNKILIGFMVLAGLMVVFGLTGWGRATNIISNLLCFVSPLFAIPAALISLRRGYTPARYYLIGWAMLIIGTVLYAMGGVLMERTFVTVYTQVIGAALEAILLSLALADRIRILRVDKETLEGREKVLVDLAVRDSLTGLYNKRYLSGRLASEVEAAVRQGEGMAVLMLDVDFFKKFNDTYGHPEGDLVLVGLTEVLKTVTRRRDTVCRYGGEEFTVILPGTGLDEAGEVAERIQKKFAGMRFRPKGAEPTSVTVSIGVAVMIENDSADTLLQRADQALYRAKRDGRNLVRSAA